MFYGILRLFYSPFAEKLFQRTYAEYMLFTLVVGYFACAQYDGKAQVGYFACAQYDVKFPIGTSCLAMTVKIKKENGGRFPFFISCFLIYYYILFGFVGVAVA